MARVQNKGMPSATNSSSRGCLGCQFFQRQLQAIRCCTLFVGMSAQKNPMSTLTWLLVGRPLARSYGVLPRTVRPLRLNRLRDCTYEEECANNFVNDLIQVCDEWQFQSISVKVFAQGALAEDVNVATEDAAPQQIEPCGTAEMLLMVQTARCLRLRFMSRMKTA